MQQQDAALKDKPEDDGQKERVEQVMGHVAQDIHRGPQGQPAFANAVVKIAHPANISQKQ